MLLIDLAAGALILLAGWIGYRIGKFHGSMRKPKV